MLNPIPGLGKLLLDFSSRVFSVAVQNQSLEVDVILPCLGNYVKPLGLHLISSSLCRITFYRPERRKEQRVTQLSVPLFLVLLHTSICELIYPAYLKFTAMAEDTIIFTICLKYE